MSDLNRIYLDHAASTTMRPGVLEGMEPWLASKTGNASSLHQEGRKAKEAIDIAREIVSAALNCEFGEVVFTSSGTESCNLAIIGAALAAQQGHRKKILLGASEHHCVLETQPILEALGFRVALIAVDAHGAVQINALEQLLDQDVLLASVQSANNETGIVQPVAEVRRACNRVGALYHCDAVQSFGLDLPDADLISVSGHKIGAPQGVGALYVRAGTSIKPILVGGGQEREMRAGTENVAAIVGMGIAVETMRADLACDERKRAARDAFAAVLSKEPLWEPTVKGSVPVLAGHCHGRFRGVSAESILIRLDRMGISASSGAACSSGSILPSHVMMAAGRREAEAKESVRFTFGWNSTVTEAKVAAGIVTETLLAIRPNS